MINPLKEYPEIINPIHFAYTELFWKEVDGERLKCMRLFRAIPDVPKEEWVLEERTKKSIETFQTLGYYVQQNKEQIKNKH